MNPEFPLLSELNKIKNLSISTPTFAFTHRCLHRTLMEASTTSTPACKHFVGHSRSGKSFIFREFEAQFPAVRTPSGLKKQVIYVQAPVKGTIKGLMEALLEALGDPNWMRGTYSNMLSRLLNLLHKVDCKMIIVDEFQHLVDKGQRFLLTGTTDWLKALVERNTFSLICVGLPSSKKIILRSEQLRNRFDATIEVPVYDWTDPDSQRVFRSLLKCIQREMAPFEVPDLTSPDLALRMFIACGGRIGLLSKILDRAVKDAIWDNRTAIRMKDLAEAFSTSIWFADELRLENGPFLGALSPNLVPDLCKHAMTLADEVPYEEADKQTHLGTLAAAKKSPSKVAVKKEIARALT